MIKLGLLKDSEVVIYRGSSIIAWFVKIVRETIALLTDDQRRQTMIQEYERMRLALGDGQVCDHTAQVILDLLN